MTGRSKGYLGSQHPLAEVAERLCAAHLGAVRVSGIGRVACGVCWEEAIRADERAVVLFGVPREIEPDPSYVDEIAVERACAGDRVQLTGLELAEAVRRLTAWGYSGGQAADVLGVNQAYVYQIRARLAAPDAAMSVEPTEVSTGAVA
jgi:hypothetical protein